MAFGLNLRAINGVCNTQSHRYTKSAQETRKALSTQNAFENEKDKRWH